MSDPTKRTCPFCAELVNVAAKLCPHCQQWLTLKSFRHPIVQAFSHILPVIALSVGVTLVIFSLLEDFRNPKPYYSEFPDSLKVLEAQMHFVQTERGLRLFLTGLLTNTSPVAWRDAEFDCRFYDANGTLVDAGLCSSYFTVLPHDDVAFRVWLEPIAPTNAYRRFEVSVGNARNAKGWF